MNKEIAAVRKVIAIYALVHCANEIPGSHYEAIVKTWRDMNQRGYNWNQDNAAAALLYASVVDRVVHISQLTPQGYKAINWAENFMRNLNAKAA